VTASRIEAVFDIDSSASLTEGQKRRLRARFGPRVTAIAQDARSQSRNRELAVARLRERIATALRPRKRRRPTKATAASRERRLATKRRRSELKRARRRPLADTD
jgi:ribosome-associated protein